VPHTETLTWLEEAQQRVGTSLRGKWTLERLIAVGGMGAVYEGRHRNGMRCAVKVLDPTMSRTREGRERFLREGRLANEAAHDGVVQVLDDDDTGDGSSYLVMELLTGATLDAVAMKRGGVLEPETVARYAAQVLDTLVAVHAHGIVHRDIKPENLFLTTDGVVKVLDFGIARVDDDSRRVTQSGVTVGTPAFMSPEQARGRRDEVDARADVYSLGATMFTLATGNMVHPAETVTEVLVSVMTQPARPVRQAGDVPRPLAAVIDRALARDKHQRFVNAIEMRVALESAYVAMTGEPIPSTPRPSLPSAVDYAPPRAIHHGRTWVTPLAAPLAVVAVCAFAMSAWSHEAAPIAAARDTLRDAPETPVIELESEPAMPVASATLAHDEPVLSTAVPVHVSRQSPIYQRRH
jgi:serine/threonine protein kinase